MIKFQEFGLSQALKILVAFSREVGMKALKILVLSLGVLGLVGSQIWGQDPSAGYGTATPSSIGNLNDSDNQGPTTVPTRATLSEWILYPRDPGCCGPTGNCKSGPILLETYFRTGPEFTVGGGVFNNVLETGWNIGGGGRSLFFNPDADQAWVIDLGVSNTHYNSNNRNPAVSLFNLPYLDRSGTFGIGVNKSLTIPAVDVGIISLNTTFVNLSGGKEYYLRGDAFNKDNSWRIGGDIGGRYGSGKTEFVGFPNLKDTIGGVFLSLHSDLQIPFGKVNLIAGLRLEWDYIWNGVLQSQNNSDLSNISLLYNGGIQF
ncbi:MAG: hypothetical protein EBT92_05820 [Planctomycetes bacterium]|nr:hypothetical protein [Planctomycetota bacterium]NBY03472.1 hypothetical protein [Planctomycetota bacterium]